MSLRTFAFSLSVLALAAPADGQTPREIMDEAIQQYEQRMEGIESYTVTQTVLGTETILHFLREESDGRVTFVPDLSETGLGPTDEAGGGATAGQAYDSNYFMRDDFVERMRVEGHETVDGHDTYVLVIDDFAGLDTSAFAGGPQGFQPSLLRMYMDSEAYIARRLDMAGTMTMGDQPSEMSTTLILKDYREVEGMLYPFLVEISTEGIGEAMGAAMAEGMSPEQQAELERAMAEMEEELEKLPEEQRAMVRQMMEGQMKDGMARMMGEAMSSIVVETLHVEINPAPPQGG